jgi:hypothetical protein
MVRCLQGRGGRVVFLRAPSSGERWRLEERFHSKKQCWDRFAQRTTAQCVHFRDCRNLAELRCPDESHLDYRDAGRFTRGLISEVRRQGMRL